MVCIGFVSVTTFMERWGTLHHGALLLTLRGAARLGLPAGGGIIGVGLSVRQNRAQHLLPRVRRRRRGKRSGFGSRLSHEMAEFLGVDSMSRTEVRISPQRQQPAQG